VLKLCYDNLYYLFLFKLQYLEDRKVDLNQIFPEDSKKDAIEKLSFWFLCSFGDKREVQDVIFSAIKLDPASQN